jgi:hypothetical protein
MMHGPINIRFTSYAFGILVGNPEEKRVDDRPGCAWEDNIKRDFQKKG